MCFGGKCSCKNITIKTEWVSFEIGDDQWSLIIMMMFMIKKMRFIVNSFQFLFQFGFSCQFKRGKIIQKITWKYGQARGDTALSAWHFFAFPHNSCYRDGRVGTCHLKKWPSNPYQDLQTGPMHRKFWNILWNMHCLHDVLLFLNIDKKLHR